MSESRNYAVLQKEILDAEKQLFEMKARFAAMRRPHGTNVISAPSPHRCLTCGNTKCLNYGLSTLKTKEGTIIGNQTAMNGCLSWLPEVEK